MKNWEKVNEVWDEIPGGDEGTDHWRQICHAFNVDPDAEYVEPAKPQPEAEYDAGWVEEFYDALLKRDTDWEQDRADLCKEAARREREKCAAQEQIWIDAGVRSVVSIRCLAHRSVPSYNTNEMGGGECAACEVEALRAELDEMVAKVDVLHATCREYEQRIADLQRRLVQPSADLAWIVERMQDLREKRVSDPDIWMLCNAVIALAQAVAGMGGVR